MGLSSLRRHNRYPAPPARPQVTTADESQRIVYELRRENEALKKRLEERPRGAPSADTRRLESENAELRQRIEQLESENAELQALLEASTEPEESDPNASSSDDSGAPSPSAEQRGQDSQSGEAPQGAPKGKGSKARR
jgi:hypothetical protein